jgi:hypothetical protein
VFQENYDWAYFLVKQRHQELLAEAEASRMIHRGLKKRGNRPPGINRIFARLGNLLSGRKGRYSESSDYEIDRGDLRPVDQCC